MVTVVDDCAPTTTEAGEYLPLAAPLSTPLVIVTVKLSSGSTTSSLQNPTLMGRLFSPMPLPSLMIPGSQEKVTVVVGR